MSLIYVNSAFQSLLGDNYLCGFFLGIMRPGHSNAYPNVGLEGLHDY